jgi:hypothetical protein
VTLAARDRWGVEARHLVAKDIDPDRVVWLRRIRWVFEPLKRIEAMVFADALEIHLRPEIGWAWRPPGTPRAVVTPGQHQTHSLAGALDRTPGPLLHCGGACQIVMAQLPPKMS